MAGGIFTNRPFEANPKCIVFAGFLALAYWYTAPKHSTSDRYGRNPWLLPIIFVAAYVAMAWYDYAYDCSVKLKSGSSPIGAAVADSIFKPQYRDADDGTESEQEKIYRRNVYLFHVMFVAVPLLYVGFARNPSRDVRYAVGLLGTGALLYHGYRVFNPRQGC